MKTFAAREPAKLLLNAPSAGPRPGASVPSMCDQISSVMKRMCSTRSRVTKSSRLSTLLGRTFVSSQGRHSDPAKRERNLLLLSLRSRFLGPHEHALGMTVYGKQ